MTVRILPILLFSLMGTLQADTAPPYQAVENAVASLEKRPGMEAATVGFALMRLDDGASEIVVDVRGRRSLIPASTMKVVTTIAALDRLAPDHTMTTSVGYQGTLADGTLTGDLVIKGGGDPTLAEYGWEELFQEWSTAVKEAGITKITGRVVGDASHFGGTPRIGTWAWKDLGNYYASGASGLTFHKNTYRVHFRPGSVGKRAQFVGTSPPLPGVTFHNEMLTGSAGSGDQGYVYAAPYAHVVFLRGSVPAGGTFTIKGALPEPALTCAERFQDHLAKTVQISGKATSMRLAMLSEEKPSGTFVEILQRASPPLDNLLQRMNHKSDNLFAETVLRCLGKAHHGEGSTESGIAAVKAYFQKREISTIGFSMEDGSGLSRLNLITPRQMVYLLKGADLFEHAETFRRSLPVAGRSGTLKSVARGTAAVGRVRAKSGTVERVKCYAGYVDARSGTRYAFAIMVNHFGGKYSAVKPGIEAVMARMAEL